MKIDRLVAELEENDPSAPIYVNIFGHLMQISQVDSQVSYAEILLIDEMVTPCHETIAHSSTGTRKNVPDSVTETIRALAERLNGTETSPEGTFTASGITEDASLPNASDDNTLSRKAVTWLKAAYQDDEPDKRAFEPYDMIWAYTDGYLLGKYETERGLN